MKIALHVVAAGLIFYAPVAAYFALQAVHQRYYARPSAGPADTLVVRQR